MEAQAIYGDNNENNDSYKWDDLWLLIGVNNNKFDGLFNYVANWLATCARILLIFYSVALNFSSTSIFNSSPYEKNLPSQKPTTVR